MRYPLFLILLLLFVPLLAAQENDDDALKRAVEEAEREAAPDDSAFERDIWFQRSGPVTFRLIDLSLIGMFAVGTSTATDEELEGLQGGGHNPHRRGFNLRGVEFTFSGAVDPLFRFQTSIVVTEEEIELEEAYFTTMSLPWDLQVKGGYYLTEFGIVNQQHAHSWDFLEQPVIVNRFFSDDNMRGLGARVSWLVPTPWFFEIIGGVQNSDNDTMVSFRGEGHDHGHDDDHGDETVGGWPIHERPTRTLGDLLYSARITNHFDFSDAFGMGIGLSGLYGPNLTGDTGKTWIGGGDLLFKWAPDGTARGTFYLKGQFEFMYRYFQADRAEHDGEVLKSTILGDWGGYGLIKFGWHQSWSFGLRAEWADAHRDGEEERVEDPLRDHRWRVSVMAEWQASEFTRFRLQYNLDHMQHLEDSSHHTVWFGLDILIGKHPAHRYGE